MSEVFLFFFFSSFELTLLASHSRRRLDHQGAESSQQPIDFKVSRQRLRSRGETGTGSSDGPLTRLKELQAEQSRWRKWGNQNMLLPAMKRKKKMTDCKENCGLVAGKEKKSQIRAFFIFWFVSCCWFIVELMFLCWLFFCFLGGFFCTTGLNYCDKRDGCWLDEGRGWPSGAGRGMKEGLEKRDHKVKGRK